MNSASPTRSRFKRVLLSRWIDSMALGPPIQPTDLSSALSNGLLLSKLLQRLIYGLQISGIYERPLTKAPCISNLEKSLEIIWKSGISPSKIPSADEIYNSSPRSVPLLLELFSTFVVKEIQSRWPIVLDFFKNLATQHSLDFPSNFLSNPFPFLLACLSEYSNINVNKSLITFADQSIALKQAHYFFLLLIQLKIPIYFSHSEYFDLFDNDFAMLQVFLVFAKFAPEQYIKKPIASTFKESDSSLSLNLTPKNSPKHPPVTATQPSSIPQQSTVQTQSTVDHHSTVQLQSTVEPTVVLQEVLFDEESADILSLQYPCDVAFANKSKKALPNSVIFVEGLPSDDSEVDLNHIYLIYCPLDPGKYKVADLARFCDRISVSNISKITRLGETSFSLVTGSDVKSGLIVSFHDVGCFDEFFQALTSLLQLCGFSS
ncbi:hypothetical protein RCL1_003952 [Eukaryota sp. TZLM3-RCL]